MGDLPSSVWKEHLGSSQCRFIYCHAEGQSSKNIEYISKFYKLHQLQPPNLSFSGYDDGYARLLFLQTTYARLWCMFIPCTLDCVVSLDQVCFTAPSASPPFLQNV